MSKYGERHGRKANIQAVESQNDSKLLPIVNSPHRTTPYHAAAYLSKPPQSTVSVAERQRNGVDHAYQAPV